MGATIQVAHLACNGFSKDGVPLTPKIFGSLVPFFHKIENLKPYDYASDRGLSLSKHVFWGRGQKAHQVRGSIGEKTVHLYHSMGQNLFPYVAFLVTYMEPPGTQGN